MSLLSLATLALLLAIVAIQRNNVSMATVVIGGPMVFLMGYVVLKLIIN